MQCRLLLRYSQEDRSLAHRRIITLAHLQRDLDIVVQEMNDLGFWTKRMESVEVQLCPLRSLIPDRALGHCDYRGHIYIPATGLARIFGRLKNYCRLRDVLRHEFGHSFACLHPQLVQRNPEFMKILGGTYDSDMRSNYDPAFHLTKYAATSPAEDFAECFMAVLKYKGKLDRFKTRPLLYKKVCWVKSLARRIPKNQCALWSRPEKDSRRL